MMTLPGFYRGDDHALKLEFRNKDTQELIDISGWSFVSTIKLSSEMPDSEGIQAIHTVPEGDEVGKLKGVVYLHFFHNQTINLIPADYVMDVQKTVDGNVQTLFTASIPILPDVTRGDIQHG